MADPVTLAGMAATAGGAIVGAIGSSYKGQAESNMYNYQAGVAQVNEQIAKQNAAYEKELGETQAQEAGMKTRAEMGQIKAAQGASGLDVNCCSAVDVQKSAQEVGTFNETMIRSNAAKRAY